MRSQFVAHYSQRSEAGEEGSLRNRKQVVLTVVAVPGRLARLARRVEPHRHARGVARDVEAEQLARPGAGGRILEAADAALEQRSAGVKHHVRQRVPGRQTVVVRAEAL